MVRLRRTSVASSVIAVTGADSGLGRALLERLALRGDLEALVAIDGSADQVGWVPSAVPDPSLTSRLETASTVVHLATSYDVTLPAASRRALNVGGTAALLAAARTAGVGRVVLCTSTDVYGARPDNPVPLPDAAALRSEPDDPTLSGEHSAIERLAAEYVRDGLAVTVVRPATLVGLSGAYDGQVLRQLAGRRLLAVRGIEPLWQLCHVTDLLAALELAALGVVSGGVAVACEGALRQSVVEERAGRRRLELPASLALATAERLQRAGLTTSSPRELDHLLGPLVVACDSLRAAGWTPRWTNEAALTEHLAARSGDARSAAYTAAGATVALLGTAALVRQARRRRRGL